MAGSSGKQENTMPVKFAIQRELEYRKIVAAFHLRPNSKFTKEVKSSNDASCPKLLPGPSSMKFSSLSGTKRKESPTRSTHHPRLKHQQPFHGSLNHEVQTGACDVKPSNDASLPKPLPGPSSIKFPSLSGTKRKESPTRSTDYLCLQHQQPFHGSRNHEMKTGATDFSLNVKSSNDASLPKSLPGPCTSKFSSLLGTKGKESPSSDHLRLQHHHPFHGTLNHEGELDDIYCKICQISCSSPSNLKQHLRGRKHEQMLQKGGSNSQMQWCEVCCIPCMNEDLLKMHFQGQKHKAKLQMLEISKQGVEAPNKPKWCALCKLWCSDEFAFRLHLGGKKHVKKKDVHKDTMTFIRKIDHAK
ncbi:hypothetical protein AAZX31_06G188700 [Glycine max]|nr:hypothetical protein GYH30_015651 [Glycine max]KAH1126729.1 hypothetical protein GYH30_015651 [Glycine max]KAH1126731.1 hypothetical protein GYH30_015651 [Glycine max]